MSQHKDITFPLWLIIVGIVLPNLLPDFQMVEKTLPFCQEYIWPIPVIKASIGVILFLVPYFIYQRFGPQRHIEEKRELFKAALKIIEARTRITIDLINDFKLTYEENKHFLSSEQDDTMFELISTLGDVRINDEELHDKSLPLEYRGALVEQRRGFLNRVEAIKTTTDKYLRKIT